MTIGALVTAGLLFGLVNAAHCAGMCGAFALHATRGPSAWGQFSLYGTGKLFAYVFLGALAGAVGGSLSAWVHPAQQVLSWAVALALLAAAVSLLRDRRAVGGSALARGVARVVGNLSRPDLPGGRFSLGALSGLVPCGVVYLAALQAAAVGSGAGGALFMAAFGLGTVPVLAAVAFAGRGLMNRWGARRWRTVGAGLLILLAAMAGLRATMVEHDGQCVACAQDTEPAPSDPSP